MIVAVAVLALGVGCAGTPERTPQDTFWNNLTALCGKSYPGVVAVDSTSSETFRDRPLELHVTDCTADTVRMPLLVGGERWVTLVVRRDQAGLHLTHLHEASDDGTGPPSGYGGDTRGTGADAAQDFYADEFTSQMREKSSDTVWTMELRPEAVFSYALRREGTPRRFRAVFDLSRGRPIATSASRN
jgi:hypothetical protein